MARAADRIMAFLETGPAKKFFTRTRHHISFASRGLYVRPLIVLPSQGPFTLGISRGSIDVSRMGNALIISYELDFTVHCIAVLLWMVVLIAFSLVFPQTVLMLCGSFLLMPLALGGSILFTKNRFEHLLQLLARE